jgi:hypothetical protein
VSRLLAADLNNDGILDVIGVGMNSSFAATASVYLGTGTGTLQPPKNDFFGSIASLANDESRLAFAKGV